MNELRKFLEPFFLAEFLISVNDFDMGGDVLHDLQLLMTSW